MTSSAQKRPVECQNTRKGLKKTSSTEQINRLSLQVKGLRFAVDRLRRSRVYLLGSIAESQEILAALQECSSPEAAAHISRYEQRLERTQARLEAINNSLAACKAALVRVGSEADGCCK